MANTGDPMVRATQIWLNRTYGNDERYNIIPESVYGKTGWTTIYALTRALQIELGIKQTADNFGPTTERLFKPIKVDNVCKNIYGIVQGALWCKGYDPGHYGTMVDGEYIIDTAYDEKVANAIKELESDAGRNNPKGIVDLNIMKALLSMDSFVKVYGGDSQIRTIQQYLNKNYENYIGLMPCDGVYGRSTNKALIYAIQAMEGLPISIANGNFGPTTQNCCPTIPYTNKEKNYNGNIYTNSQIVEFIKLLEAGLYCNGYDIGFLSGLYDETLSNTIKKFQKDYVLSVTGTAVLQTWLSIFISCGDINRSCVASDTRFEMTDERLNYLKSIGIQYVGRYLTGGDFKQLRPDEPQRIIDHGINFFPIFQESGLDITYFTPARGIQDATNAFNAAKNFRIPRGTIIYFAVDADPQDGEISAYILPYFKALWTTMKEYNHYYNIGIYGTRNTCTRVIEKGYALTSFVSDMSTGWSGNMGFKIPNNWNFDQFNEIKVTTASGTWDLDKVAYSGKFPAVKNLDPVEPEEQPNEFQTLIDQLEKLYRYATEYSNINNKGYNTLDKNKAVLKYLRHKDYYGTLWSTIAGDIDQDFIDFIKSKNDNSLNVENIKIPKDGFPSMSISHLAATTNAILHQFIIFDNESNDLAGWAGDLLQLGCVLSANIGNRNFTNEDIYNFIGCYDDALANKLLSNGNTIFNATMSGFGLEDYEVDLDAISLGKEMMNNIRIDEAFVNYYITNKYIKRADNLIDSIISNYTEENMESKLIEYAKRYTKVKTATAQLFVANFEATYGSYNAGKFGDVLAEQFAKKIINERKKIEIA